MATWYGEENMCCACLEFVDTLSTLLCTHTLCKGCLDSASAGTACISCPVCHSTVPVGPDGPATTTTAFAAGNGQERDRSLTCSDHPGCEFTFLCEDCALCVCSHCKEDKHFQHDIRPITNTDTLSKTEYIETLARLSVCEGNLRCALERVRQTEQATRERQAALDRQIRARKETLQQWVHEASMKSLVALENISKQFIATLHGDQRILTDKSRFLSDMKKNMIQALVGVSDHPGNSSKREAVRGRSLKKKLVKLVSNLPHHTGSQVLRVNDLAVSRHAVLDFMGTVVRFMPVSLAPEMTFRPAFRCNKDSETEVHALCPMNEGRVWVSYGSGVSSLQETVCLYSKDGVAEKTRYMDGRACVARMRGDWVIVEGRDSKAWFFTPTNSLQWQYTGPEKEYRLYCKLNARFYLCGHKNGTCDLRSLTIKEDSSGMPAISGTKVCTLNLSTPPFAVDVSKDGKIIAVLAHGNDNFLIFNASPDSSEPCLTFSPHENTSSLKPRDLCFFPFGGCELLVVADWLNDVLVLLHVTGENCMLIGHLGAGCPLLKKPTAVTADECGRLWIGCEGGQLVVGEQKEP